MIVENVVQFPAKLDTLAERIRGDLDRRKRSKAEWVAATLDLCVALAEARAEFKDNISFGKWFDAGGFDLNKNERAAAIAMGREIDHARTVLLATERRSLEVIHNKEFRVPNTRKTKDGIVASPQSKKPPHPRPKTDAARAAVERAVASGQPLSRTTIAAETGVGEHAVQLAILEHHAEQRVLGMPLDELKLSGTAQQKLDAHIRQFEKTFNQRVEAEAQKKARAWREEHLLPTYFEKIEKLENMLNWPRYSVMTKSEYNKILKCLHPDTMQARTLEDLAEAFQIFTSYKLKMIKDEEIRKAALSDLPRTVEELLARKKTRKPS